MSANLLALIAEFTALLQLTRKYLASALYSAKHLTKRLYSVFRKNEKGPLDCLIALVKPLFSAYVRIVVDHFHNYMNSFSLSHIAWPQTEPSHGLARSGYTLCKKECE